MKLKILVATSALLVSGIAVADSYQSEVRGAITRTDYDGLSSNKNGYVATGRYHFDAVNTANLPLAEAAYLGKNSNVYAGAARLEQDDESSTGYQLGAQFYVPENFLFFEGGVARSTGDGRNDWYRAAGITPIDGLFTGDGDDDNDWYAAAGVTPIDGLLVTTKYWHDEGYDPNISAKYVTALGAGEFLNVEAEIIDGDNTTYKAIGADYYLDTTFSVGGKLENAYSDNSYTIRTRKFFAEQWSGELAYTDAPDGSIIMAGASIRF